MWSADLTSAPKTQQILMRHPDWECPAVVKWGAYDDWSGWVYADTLLADVAGSVDDEFLSGAEWAPIPE